MKTLFIILPGRIYISDIIHTPYLQELAKKHRVHVFLLSDDPHKPLDVSAYYVHPNVSYHPLYVPYSRYWTLMNWLLRSECIRRYKNLKPIIWRDDRARHLDLRRRLLHRLMKLVPKRTFSTDFFSWIERYTMPDTRTFRACIEKYKPDLVVTSSPGFAIPEAHVIAVAHRAGVPTVAFNFSWDNLTNLARHIRKTKYLICWNTYVKEKARDLHDYSDDRLFVSGIIRFDPYFRTLKGETDRDTFLTERGLDPKRKTVLYAARTYGTFYRDFIRSFIMWQQSDAFIEPVNLFVRIHPLDDPGKYEEFKDAPNVHIGLAGTLMKEKTVSQRSKVETREKDWVEKKDTIRHTDICVNLASTFSLEAFIFDKPVISADYAFPSVSFLAFPHLVPLVESGSLRAAGDMNDILTHVNTYLRDPSIDREARRRMLDYFVAPTDGYSHERNISFLEEVMQREDNI